ncbi:hypothetical protein [Cumulibacter manganitolerans]|uniref:hypothetical protein n=1 Tax=Cumulibacter manganitolerans TaxID=1884992 RepID=UPI001297083F|nr:hypothetical protein [Cumulibacter manganitolerans]
MKRLGTIVSAAVMMLGMGTAAYAATTVDLDNAPNGTHFVKGTTADCTVDGGVVTCGSYELAGVGNIDATASLDATYAATVNCRNHGGQVVESHSQSTSVASSTGALSPENGRLTVPTLTSGMTPSAAQFEEQATCPNPNWTSEVDASSIALTGYTYTLSFDGYTEPAVTITG